LECNDSVLKTGNVYVYFNGCRATRAPEERNVKAKNDDKKEKNSKEGKWKGKHTENVARGVLR
jgi:hypothetical protein